jgi:8-oxo-dGTP pyrophosphatase MutT (NUDIX family)
MDLSDRGCASLARAWGLHVGHDGKMTAPLDRPSARVIVIDGTDSVLLFLVKDPLDPKPPLWITPGGGINPGEALSDAAARELSEETGLVIDPAELGDPVATCRGEWTFRGQPLYSVETFFALRTDRFELTTAGWEPLEHEVHAAWRWWTIEEIDTTSERILPARLGDLARLITQGMIGSSPIELPWVNFDQIAIDPSTGSTKG